MYTQLQRLTRNYQMLNHPIINYLKEPLHNLDLIDNYVESTFNIVSNELNQLKLLYSWHNGTIEDCRKKDRPEARELFPQVIFNSFEQWDNYQKETDEQGFRQQYMLPIMLDSGGGYYSIKVCPDADRMIYYTGYWTPLLGAFTSIFDSIEAMIKTINGCYESGAFFINEDGVAVADIDKYYLISTQLNPLSEYWPLMNEN